MYKRILNNIQGFSLIEVLTSIVIFSFLVIGVLMMSTMNIQSNSYAQHHTKAVQLAESGLELLRRVNYTTELPNYDGVSAIAFSDYGQIPNYPDFRRSLLVTWGTELSILQVTVTWRVRGRDSFPMVLTTERVSQ